MDTASTSCSDPNVKINVAPSSIPKRRSGRKKFRETRHPVFRGVRSRGLNSDRWVCEVRVPEKQTRIWLGTYPTAEMAARAHDVAVLALKGPNACLNFADSAWRLPVPVSNAAPDIRKAATEGARMFLPEPEPKPEGLVSNGDHQKSVDHNFEEDEGLFDLEMPGSMFDLGEGVLLSPSYSLQDGFSSFEDMENYDANEQMSLWSYSF